ncbi:FAD-dependent oxidoreductase [Flexithrix dorotheae]|uniref:FAD-dependent oxidoreductase n=1 Tax=Flexithrix dorotheae TaxID=70993 RepID=UPI0003749118|nr:FAD-dependent oxidoreductase [Flexithrix dorotheae]
MTKGFNKLQKERRKFMVGASLLGFGLATGLTSCASTKYNSQVIAKPGLAKLRISTDRVIKETVGLRPFRKNGFRLESEELGNKTIVHNYGHGGSGWSLSWGTSNMAVEKAIATGADSYAVMGCGVIGLTSARLLQLAGKKVTIYTKDLPPNITSSKATGTWSPSYSVIEDEYMTESFKTTWKKACLFSFKSYQNLLGLNDEVKWVDDYFVDTGAPRKGGHSSELHVDGLLPKKVVLTGDQHPFQFEHVTWSTTMVFNIPGYLQKMMNDFFRFGGKLEIKSFESTEDVDQLAENCIINCTGLGAKAIFKDENLMPIAGQLSFLIPQDNFNYRLTTPGGYAIPRKDGIVLGGNTIKGSWDTTPSKAQTEKVVNALSEVINGMKIG